MSRATRRAEKEQVARAAKGDWRSVLRLRRFMMPHKWAIFGSLFLLLAQAAADLAKPWPLKFAFDNVLPKKNLQGGTLRLLIIISVLVVVIAIVDGLFSYLLTLVLNRSGRAVVFEIRTALFDRVHSLSLQYYSHRSTGDLITRLTSDVKALGDIFTESIAEILNSFIYFAGMATVLFLLDWQLALVAFAATPFLFITLRHYTPRIKANARAERERDGRLSQVVHDSLGTMRMTRVFNQEEATKRRFREESSASLQSGMAAALKSERFAWVVDVLGDMVTAGVLGFGVHRVMVHAMTPGELIVFVTYVRNFWKPMRTAIKQMNKITTSSAQIERIAELLDENDDIVDLPGARPAPRLTGPLSFHDVTLEYAPGQRALDGVNLLIPSGQVTAIVGSTGAGKTSLVSLVPRLYDPTTGSVEIDGVDIRSYTLQSLRSQIGFVLQESVLLQASIAENIAYGRPDASIDDIVAAAKAANAHGFIERLPEGYNTIVGARGETFSGGQRQCIAIARAIIRDTPILILDEPLTGLDAESGATVLAALRRLMEGRTVLIVTHQLQMIGGADQVLVLDRGRIVQQGRHEDLVQQDGKYRTFIESAGQNADTVGLPREPKDSKDPTHKRNQSTPAWAPKISTLADTAWRSRVAGRSDGSDTS